MDHPHPDRPSRQEPTPDGSAALDANASVPHRRGAATLDPSAPLGELLVAMQSDDAALREAAWAACYERYYQVVWTRVFYVMRSIAWLSEPREAAADVTSDVFVGLPDEDEATPPSRRPPTKSSSASTQWSTTSC